MENDSFRQESPVNTSKKPSFFPELDTITPDGADQIPVETGSYTRWYNQADGSVQRGTHPWHRFQSRRNHGQQHQSHMMRCNRR
ncbi:hypothetical protein TNCV_4279641 [Trichonephila clavipes]|nr:hypothetical protein TNCV_4279641 [Trichonephila clavipes]